MLTNFPNFDFLTQLTSRIGFKPGSETSIEGCGRQAVVVAAGDSVYKVFSASKVHCGTSAQKNEVKALERFGGYEGDVIRTPALKSHFLFPMPFHIQGRDYIGMIEQSRMPGNHSTLTSRYQQAAVGDALGEFHHLLETRAGHDFNRDILAGRIALLQNRKSKSGHAVLPGLRKRLLSDVSKMALTAPLRPVHGDFHLGNVLFDANKFAIIDLATIGKSPIEQDMTAFAHDPEKLKNIFDGYANRRGKKPSHSRTMTLYALDLAIATESAHQGGDQKSVKKYLDRLQSALS